MDGYRHRIMDSLLEKKLQAKGAVLIEGLNGVERPLQQRRLQAAKFCWLELM